MFLSYLISNKFCRLHTIITTTSEIKWLKNYIFTAGRTIEVKRPERRMYFSPPHFLLIHFFFLGKRNFSSSTIEYAALFWFDIEEVDSIPKWSDSLSHQYWRYHGKYWGRCRQNTQNSQRSLSPKCKTLSHQFAWVFLVFFHNSKASEKRVILYSQAELLRWVKSFRWIAETVPILSTKNSSILKTQCRKKKITDIYHHRHRGRSHVFSAVSTAWDNRLRSQDPGEAMGMRLNFNNDQNHYWTSISQKMRWRLLRSALPPPPPPKKKRSKQNKRINKETNLKRKGNFILTLYCSVNLSGEVFLVISSNSFKVPWPRLDPVLQRIFS